MKKAIIVYLSVLTLFLGITAFTFQFHANPGEYLLSDYTKPSQIQKINLNTATAEQLQLIPGIGPALSERIIAYRQDNGPFTCIEDTINIKGIGKYLLSRLETYSTVGD